MSKPFTKEEVITIKTSWRRFLCFVVLPPLLLIPLIHLIFSARNPEDGWERVRAAWHTDNPEIAKRELAKLITLDPNRVRSHYVYLYTHFSLPKREGDNKRNDTAIYREYQSRSKSTRQEISDIGSLGMGVYYLRTEEPNQALSCLANVKNRKLRYLHYVTGRVHDTLKSYDQAEQSYRREIELKGYIGASVHYLAYLFYEQKRFDDIEKLYAEPGLREDIPNHVMRILHLRSGNLQGYIIESVNKRQENLNLVGFLGAVLITLVWLYFLKRLDIFEPEKGRYILGTLVLGMLFTFLGTFLYDIFDTFFHFRIRDDWKNDFFYCIFGIGLIEELVKAIPFFLILKFTRQVNESIDYIIYAATSALGFAFMENLLYFDEVSLFSIHGRGFICAIVHMTCTALIGYGILRAKYIAKGRLWSHVFGFFFLACLLHGIYDYWIVSDDLPKPFRVFSFLIALIVIFLFNRMIHNALNQSEHFNTQDTGKLNYMFSLVGGSLMMILMFEYICLSWKYGPELTYVNFTKVLYLSAFFILFLSSSLGTYTLQRKGWVSLWKSLVTSKRKK